MSQILQAFILIPLLAFLVSLLLPRKTEGIISGLAIAAIGFYFVLITGFTGYWLFHGSPVLDIKHIVFFKADNLEIFIDLYFDRATAVFAWVGSAITLLVVLFSKFYLHRDEGFNRFFSTTLLFYTGYNLVVFSGNYETLFIGWELLGICSFILIGYYRDRYLPVKNAIKVISVYRLSDICLILAMWMSHHLWHENITFFKLNDAALLADHLQEAGGYAAFIAVMVVVAAAVKSAQLPFSSWLPRAMEGPTTSSAIFYGSLSVHIGVFILLRTYPYWEDMMVIRVMIVAIGIATSLIASGIARVQSTVKTQIAYSSVTQIGLMFIEVALGFHTLALLHFAGNAFLRTYQLLVSPSVLSYLIHDMVFNFKPGRHQVSNSLMGKIKSTVYVLSIREYNLDSLLQRFLWNPFKVAGNAVGFITGKVPMLLLLLLLAGGVYIAGTGSNLPAEVDKYLPVVFSVAGLLLVLRSFTEREDAGRGWGLVILSELFITLSVALAHEGFGYRYVLMYLSGIVVAAIVGYLCLNRVKAKEEEAGMGRFHGHAYEHPLTAFVFIVACLALVGLPFTPTFIGMDVMFSHIGKHDIPLIFVTAVNFLVLEIAVLRIYSRVFLGQHTKAYHPIAYRSS